MTAGPLAAALAVAASAFVAAATLTGVARRYALSRSLLDVPNERSSHTVPTPRGGGIAIVAVVLAGLLLLAGAGRVGPRVAAALVGGGALVAAVGWLDDHRGVPAVARLLVHAAAAAWAVAWLDGMPRLTIGEGAASLGAAGALLAVLGIVWATNLYNFMDGIDGLAAGEAVVAGLVAGWLLFLRAPFLAPVAILLAGAAAGFLVWNWPPARIFLGDVGSGFLGFLFGALAVASENAGALPALLWLVLLGPFFLDATVTLFRRMARRERWHTAHRSHAYQRAVQAGWSHRRVTTAVCALTAALGVLAGVAVRGPALLLPVLAAAALLLGAVYVAVERRRPMPEGD